MPLQKNRLNGNNPNLEPRKIDWARIALAVFISCFIFTFGILAGYFGRDVLEGSIIGIQEHTKNELLSIETITLLDDNYPCSNSILETTSEKLNELGDLITLLEKRKGFNDEEVLELKKLYSLIEIRHMLLLTHREKECKQNYNIFLFFYSNEKTCKSEVDKLAFILSYLRKNEESIKVYSFDIWLDSDLIKILKEENKISGCSGIVLNGKKVTKDIYQADQLKELLKNNVNKTLS